MTTPSGSEDLDELLRRLREQQASLAAAGQDESLQMRAIARDIAATSMRLGFAPEEAVAIAEQIEPPAFGPGHAMAGEYRVLRGAAEPILTFSAFVIAGAVIGLGQPAAGGAVIVAAIASWIIRGARRVARLRIDQGGAPGFPGRIERIDARELLSVDFAYRYPPWIAEHQKAASETVDLRLGLRSGGSIKLARGPLWRTSPRREPVAWHQVERHFLAYARDAGLTITRADGGWFARRR